MRAAAGLQVIRCATPAAFLEQAGPYLLDDEACHNQLLGTAAALVADGLAAAPRSYFAVVSDAGEVVAAAMMTPPQRLILSRTGRPEAPALIARDLRAAGMMPPGVHGPVPQSGQFAEAWQYLTGRRAKPGLRERIYRLDRVRSIAGVPGHLRRADEADRPLLIRWVRDFLAEAFGGEVPPGEAAQVVDRRLRRPTEGLHLWDDGGPRTLAGYAGPTPHGIRVGLVYTPPEHRARGYGSACVAALSQLLLDCGHRFCCLYADLANPASNRIYQRIGYEPVCDVAEYRFLPATG